MKYPPKSITFRSRVIGLRVAKMSSQRHALAKKIFWKYQQISANFSNCDGVYFQKRIISTTGECALKKNSATIFFVYYNINQFKNLKMSRPWKQLPIHWSGGIFPFHLVFPNEGCSCAAQLHHIKKWSVEFVQEVVKYVWKIHNSFHWSDQKHLFLTNFWGAARYISSWYIQIRKKSTQRLVWNILQYFL